ncbi:MAG: aldehyde dehydrogenase family protein, partial [Myxococcales bacterium]|nr:aldehyde dehydrogenase family protein [Myxococcales bacterium]
MALRDIPPGTPVVVGQKACPMPHVHEGDRVLPVAEVGELLVLPRAACRAAEEAVAEARDAFATVSRADPQAISHFFQAFAAQLADDRIWQSIAQANEGDVARAKVQGRHVGRLTVSAKMRADMIAGLEGWAKARPRVGEVVERREGDGFRIERRRAPLGVVAFVFEGRPNVFADGAGVLRNGNTAVMRIGGAALDTALAIEAGALGPALDAAGLPRGAVRLVRSRDRAAGQALFTLRDVRLAVARGSGPVVALLGAIAESHGIPASLHGTGGAWIYVEASASREQVERVLTSSLDRKVCNTLNTLVIDEAAVAVHGATVAATLADLGAVAHVARGGARVLAGAALDEGELGHEWEWDERPELTVCVAAGLDDAAALFNRYSPRFV